MTDYRASHTSPEKGREYARSFLENNNKRFIWEWEQQVLSEIVTNLRKSSGKDQKLRHLDFACGTGRILGYMRQFVGDSIGVDVSDSMLKQAQHNAPSSELMKRDLTTDNPFPRRSFDLITAFRFFVNAQDHLRAQAMQELSTLVRPDGVLVFNVHVVRSSIFGSSMLLYKRLKRDRSGTFRTMSIGEVHELLTANDLTIVKTYHRGIIPIYNDDSERVPFGLLRPLEKFFSKLRIFRPLSRYIIFVCRLRGVVAARQV